MDSILSRFRRGPVPNNADQAHIPNRETVVAELRAIRERINCTRTFFDNECDEDMIEACVYELEALGARHRYLMKLLSMCDT